MGPICARIPGFLADLGSAAPEMPRIGVSINALPANSLRIRTGKFVGACRELEQVIREIIRRRIKEFDFEAILDDIGALKMPFLAHTGRKFDRFPDVAASPSCTPNT
jgi:hypothetical protein